MKNKVLSAALSLVIAFVLWFYVITVVSPGSEDWVYDIPVVFEGETVLTEDRGMMITSRSEDVLIDLKLSGNRTDLAKVNRGNITIKVDLSKVYDPGEHELTFNPIFPGDVPSGALTVESKYPETVKLTVEKKVKKPVDVRVNFVGSAAENFMVDTENRILDYPTVNVTGPSSVVDLIDHAQISVDLTDRVESISENFRYTLCDADGNPVDVELVTTDVAEVHLDVKIQRFKQIPLTLALTYGGGTTEHSVEVIVEPAYISVSGSELMLEDLNEIQLGSIDLSAIEADFEQTYPITIPEGITNLSERTEATVKVQFLNLAIMDFEVTDITTANVPEGMEAELMSQVLKVRLRGPAAIMKKLTAQDIKVVVDFSGKELGSFTIKPTITVSGEAFANVGAVGSYSVSATLREIVEETTEEE
ncbi:MAG: hypothetical protein E7431_07475 [Ruminococcaceae bacterium]|nr:hypothetical protein [Oscillospiraceae bacterium]